MVPYISKAFSILKDADIDATGVTSPWDFGEQILDDYEEAISLSIKNVYGKNEAWYFLHMLFDTPNARPWLADNRDGRKLVSVPGTINDFFCRRSILPIPRRNLSIRSPRHIFRQTAKAEK